MIDAQRRMTASALALALAVVVSAALSGAVLVITGLSGTVADGSETGAPMLEVELDVFSGRPNPGWRLSAAESAELMALLDALPGGPERMPPALGYRGFVVHDRSGSAGAQASPLRVFDGTVKLGDRHLADARGAEAWLQRSARAHGHGAVINSVTPR